MDTGRFEKGFVVEWETNDGENRVDFFPSDKSFYSSDGTYREMSFVHIYLDPKEGVLNFLEKLPFNDVKIYPLYR